MNLFGRSFRLMLIGESHGPITGVVVDGHPAGISIQPEDFEADLTRRRPGRPGTTSRREKDHPIIQSGLFNGRTTGAPLTIIFKNEDKHARDYTQLRYIPRPGHADWAAEKKYGGHNDYRGGGRFSGRLTVGLVAAGVVAKKIIHPARLKAEILEIGGSQDFETVIQDAVTRKDSVGGLIECRGGGLPVGMGEPFFDSLEAMISHIIFSIPAIKGIEFGSGFQCSRMRGSECNDPITDKEGRTSSNHSGGISGGISNGNQLVFRVAVKPTPSIARSQKTADIKTGEMKMLSISGRHDACIALRMPVIAEAAAAVALADLFLRKTQVFTHSKRRMK